MAIRRQIVGSVIWTSTAINHSAAGKEGGRDENGSRRKQRRLGRREDLEKRASKGGVRDDGRSSNQRACRDGRRKERRGIWLDRNSFNYSFQGSHGFLLSLILFGGKQTASRCGETTQDTLSADPSSSSCSWAQVNWWIMFATGTRISVLDFFFFFSSGRSWLKSRCHKVPHISNREKKGSKLRWW